jgi:hypothetical protein
MNDLKLADKLEFEAWGDEKIRLKCAKRLRELSIANDFLNDELNKALNKLEVIRKAQEK